MHLLETLVVYLLVGAVVAGAIQLGDASTSPTNLPLHVVCWPLFAAVLVAPEASTEPPATDRDALPTGDRDHPDIRRAERKLVDALDRLDGPAEDALEASRQRIRRLVDSLATMQSRLDEMDDMLGRKEFDEEAARRALEEARQQDASSDRIASAERRLEHVRQLQTMRADLADDLQAALAKVDEIAAQIALLQFADQPARDVSDLIEEIAAAVDGVSEGFLEPNRETHAP